MRPVLPLLVLFATAPMTQIEAADEGLFADGFITDLEILGGVRGSTDDMDDIGPSEQFGAGLQFQSRGLDWMLGVHVGAMWQRAFPAVNRSSRY